MQLTTLFLMPDERPQLLMYICPSCGGQNFAPAIADLTDFICRRCGIPVDATVADLEILADEHKQVDEVFQLLIE